MLQKSETDPKSGSLSKWNGLTDFNCMSTYLGLFYANRLGNCIHSMFIFTFLYSATKTLGQSEPRSNVNEGVIHTLELESFH